MAPLVLFPPFSSLPSLPFPPSPSFPSLFFFLVFQRSALLGFVKPLARRCGSRFLAIHRVCSFSPVPLHRSIGPGRLRSFSALFGFIGLSSKPRTYVR